MTYEQALGYLSSMQRFGIKPGLSRVGVLALELGNPQERMKHLHIAGTNGKGSVAAMAESVLRQAGIITGLFTSPHLAGYEERIKVCGKQVGREELAALAGKVKGIVDWLVGGGLEPPTEFEICTAMCFEHFSASGVELAVMEVGLGGRYDSTNIITPEASVITHVSYDHMEKLGKSLSQIAFDKCGILKKGVPAVSARQEDEAMAMIEREAAAKGVRLSYPGRGYCYKTVKVALTGTELEYYGTNLEGTFRTRLVGVHQADNAAAALAAVDVMMGLGWDITRDDAKQGLAQAVHPGRFEVVGTDPVVILDGAHNADGAAALAATLGRVMGGTKPVAVVGFSADKDYKGMLGHLAPRISSVFATAPSHTRSGARDSEAVAEEARTLGLDSAAVSSPEEALSEGLAKARGKGLPLLICGSLYLVGELRSRLMED